MSTLKLPPKMNNKEKEQFDRLLNDESSDDMNNIAYNKASWRRNQGVFLTYASFALLAIISLVLVAVVSANIATSNRLLTQARDEIANIRALTSIQAKAGKVASASSTDGTEFGHCGSTVTEARHLGCVFDAMSWAWQRPECYHAELVDDFLSRMDWKLYLSNDTLESEEVSREAWERGDYVTLYVDKAWHFFHCMYSWRKFHEAFDKRMPMDNDIAMFGHTMHCDGVFLHNLDPRLIGTSECDSWPEGCRTIEVTAGFNRCGWY
ncbi:hypothetical protein F4804DRAFT_318803 [Jackrogersella minutella]|nr:hypothetical protein F4804DRAFT_318803 [Jackrogersella minutella]